MARGLASTDAKSNKRAAVSATKARQQKVRQGRAGVESRYYQIRGYRSTTPHTDDSGKRNPEDVLRIAANDLSDVMEYLKRFEADFDVHQIKLIGMLIVTSGTPYYG